MRASGRDHDQVGCRRDAQKSKVAGVMTRSAQRDNAERWREGDARAAVDMPRSIQASAHLSIRLYIRTGDMIPAPRFQPHTVTDNRDLADAGSDAFPHGRRASISRDDLLAAALRLIGPHRSLSSLSLREVTREAGIAPNSFYRQFRDMDELAVALIDLAGRSLRKIIGAARHRATTDRSIVRGSVTTFMKQLRDDDKLLHVLMREGAVGSDAFKQAVDRELQYFEEELRIDLERFAAAGDSALYQPALVARAITRLVFALGATAMDLPPERDPELIRQLSAMVRMIISGARVMAKDSLAATRDE